MLLALVPMNTGHGPDREEGMWYVQMQQAVEAMFADHYPHSFDLFVAAAPGILSDMQGEFENSGGAGDTLTSLWEHLREHYPAFRKGNRVKLCEHMSWMRGATSMLTRCHWLRLLCECVGLEMGMFGAGAFKNIMVTADAQKAAVQVDTADASVPQLDAKMLRSSCQNAVSASWAILSSPPPHTAGRCASLQWCPRRLCHGRARRRRCFAAWARTLRGF